MTTNDKIARKTKLGTAIAMLSYISMGFMVGGLVSNLGSTIMIHYNMKMTSNTFSIAQSSSERYMSHQSTWQRKLAEADLQQYETNITNRYLRRGQFRNAGIQEGFESLDMAGTYYTNLIMVLKDNGFLDKVDLMLERVYGKRSGTRSSGYIPVILGLISLRSKGLLEEWGDYFIKNVVSPDLAVRNLIKVNELSSSSITKKIIIKQIIKSSDPEKTRTNYARCTIL